MNSYQEIFESIEAQEQAAHAAAKKQLNLLLDRMTADEIIDVIHDINSWICDC